MRRFLLAATSFSALALLACNKADIQTEDQYVASSENPARASQSIDKTPTIQDAKEFIQRAEKLLLASREQKARADWILANFITQDTRWAAQKAKAAHLKILTRLSIDAVRFSAIDLPADMTRKLDRLKRINNLPAPQTEGAAEELAALTAKLENNYNQIRVSHKDGHLTRGDAAAIMARSRDPDTLSAVWEGLRESAPQSRNDYERMVEIANQGARELGYADTGALWRDGYDMSANEFAAETDRLWKQVKPLYDELHCHVRGKLNDHYGDDIVPLDEPIRADLLGNSWGQHWGNIYDLVVPPAPTPTPVVLTDDSTKDTKPNQIAPKAERVDTGINLTERLKENDYTEIQIVEAAEEFFTSLGFDALPESFWTRSLFTRPRDRNVTCHASAWNIDDKDDVRVKMCLGISATDFLVAHHELGHSFYQLAYKNQSIIYRAGAHDGFHEAVGDMAALSITPQYLVDIGLVEKDDLPNSDAISDADISHLMRSALDRVAFLPFGLVVDQWRWNVFSGEYSPADYNESWWTLRSNYQGIRPPVTRSESDFDAGAKYHITSNVPYTRYFLSYILQFQFHKAACDIAKHEGPLHKCSVYDNKDVGRKLNAMLELGASKPWRDALEAFTGTREMDGSAMIEYYAPLTAYLKAQNKNRSCGW